MQNRSIEDDCRIVIPDRSYVQRRLQAAFSARITKAVICVVHCEVLKHIKVKAAVGAAARATAGAAYG